MKNDVTAHAEMLAITSGTNTLGAKYLVNCTLYVTVIPPAIIIRMVRPCAYGTALIAWT